MLARQEENGDLGRKSVTWSKKKNNKQQLLQQKPFPVIDFQVSQSFFELALTGSKITMPKDRKLESRGGHNNNQLAAMARSGDKQ